MISIWKRRGISFLLRPLSLIYGLIVGMRNRRFDVHSKKISRLSVPVLSVGNVTVGGAGKTPLVIAITEWIQEEGKQVAILSRGYGRAGRSPLVVSDRNQIKQNVQNSGDEPLMMAQRLRGVPVLVGPERVQSGRIAIEQFNPDLLIMDDGFQHRRLARDLNVVIIDATLPFGNGWILPAGPLREPLSALKRADLVILSRSDQSGDTKALIQSIQKWSDAPILKGRHKPLDWFRLDTEEILPLDHLRDRFCLAFSGIGNPESFEKTVRSTGIKRLKSLRFADHHRYTKREYRRIDRAAEKFGAVALVTTEKDGVRLSREWRAQLPLPVYVLRVEFEVDRGRETVMQMLAL